MWLTSTLQFVSGIAAQGRAVLVLVPIVAFLLLSACADDREGGIDLDTMGVGTDTSSMGTDDAGSATSIYDALRAEGRFSQFVAAIDSAGLDQTLSGSGPYTLFVPTNDAFRTAQTRIDSLMQSDDPNQLRGVLLYHIAGGESRAQDLRAGTRLRTLEGSELSVTGSAENLQIGGAQVVETDLEAGNGVMHVVNRLLTPAMNPEGI